jgi:hypothetical protein
MVSSGQGLVSYQPAGVENMSRMATFFALVPVVLGFWAMGPDPALGRDWLVPQQAPTIPAAMDSSVTGDVVVLSPGIYDDCSQYSENVYHIAVMAPGVSLRGSTGDPADVILDAGYAGRCLEVRNGSGEVIIEAITLRRGRAVSPFGKGGAVFSIFSDTVFRSCVFDSNQADFGGAAISASYGSLRVEDCLFTHNSTTGIGAAVQVSRAPTTITGSTITGCTGTAVHYATDALTMSNTIIHGGDSASLSRNTTTDPDPDLDCCNFYDNEEDYPDFVEVLEDTDGNISLDPLFCNPLFGDYHLYAISPCAEANTGDCGRIGAFEAACGFGSITRFVFPDGTGDHPTIQDAVNAAVAGDTIALVDGVFTGPGNRDVDLLGKELTIRGHSGDPALTVIDCQGTTAEPHRAFLFQNGETLFTVVRDLTITGGEHPGDGGAIWCSGSPVIENVVFDHNGANRGGAMFVHGGNPRIIDCVFTENRGDARAGGIALIDSESRVTDCVFTANWGYIGSAVFLPDSSQVIVEGCTITANNSSLDKDCVGVDGNSSLTLRNCNITFNNRHAVRDYGDGSVSITGSNVFGNAEGDYDGPLAGQEGANGNISADPLYCAAENRDFTMRADSPCTEYSAPNLTRIGAFEVGCDSPTIFSDQSGALSQVPTMSEGVSVVDMDGDGLLDFLVANDGQANEVMLGDGAGGFTVLTEPLLTLTTLTTMTSSWADFDNDGDSDVYLGNSGVVNMLGTNSIEGFQVDFTGLLSNTGGAGGSSWADFNKDGNLDLFVASLDSTSVLLRGDGLGGFVEVTSEAVAGVSGVVSAAWGDYDNDGDQDLYVVQEGLTAKLLKNATTMTDATVAPLNLTGANGAASWGDHNNDGRLDLFLARDDLANKLLQNSSGGTFTGVTKGPLGHTGSGRGGIWGDWDNDGDLDLFVTNCGEKDQLLRNDGGGRFVDVADAVFAQPDSSTGAAWGDFDGDGDLDLVVATRSGPTRYLRNDLDNGHNWLRVKLTRLNGQAGSLGARAKLVTDTDTLQIREMGTGGGWLSFNEPVLHFGVGLADTVRSLEVSWPGGQTLTETDLLVNQVLEWTEPEPEDISPAPEHPDFPELRLALMPAYPNPFNPRTTLTFTLPRRQEASLDVYDVRGRKVTRLLHETMEPGRHTVIWQGTDQQDRPVAAGVYLVRLRAGQQTRTRGITLIK